MSLPLRQRLRQRCLVCSEPLTWPAIHFCGPTCSEAWIAKAREREGAVLEPRGKA